MRRYGEANNLEGRIGLCVRCLSRGYKRSSTHLQPHRSICRKCHAEEEHPEAVLWYLTMVPDAYKATATECPAFRTGTHVELAYNLLLSVKRVYPCIDTLGKLLHLVQLCTKCSSEKRMAATAATLADQDTETHADELMRVLVLSKSASKKKMPPSHYQDAHHWPTLAEKAAERSAGRFMQKQREYYDSLTQAEWKVEIAKSNAWIKACRRGEAKPLPVHPPYSWLTKR